MGASRVAAEPPQRLSKAQLKELYEDHLKIAAKRVKQFDLETARRYWLIGGLFLVPFLHMVYLQLHGRAWARGLTLGGLYYLWFQDGRRLDA